MKTVKNHEELSRIPITNITEIRKLAGILRNAFLGICDVNDGETPTIVEIGSLEQFQEHHDGNHDEEWEPTNWRYELHVGCGDICPVLAIIPYDDDCGSPDYSVARAISLAGGLILDLLSEIERLKQMATKGERQDEVG